MRHLKRFRSWLGYVYSSCRAFGQEFGTGDSYRAADCVDELAQKSPPTADLTFESEPTVATESSCRESETVTPTITSSGARTQVQEDIATSVEQAATESSSQHSEKVSPTIAFTAPTPVQEEIAAESSSQQSETVSPTIASTGAPTPVQEEIAAPVEQATESSSQQSETVSPTIASTGAPTPIQEEIATPVEQAAVRPVTEKLVPEKKAQRMARPTYRAAPVREPKKPGAPTKRVPQPPIAAQSSLPKPQARQAVPSSVTPNGSNGTDSAPAGGKYLPGAINDQTAQRLARLLISEIKLYYMSNTNGENAGELNNIYDRLKGPIDQSRQHYKQRLGATAIETMPDYFYGELVRLLCAGDPSRLGPNYQPPDERT
jgi:hypothetical protein